MKRSGSRRLTRSTSLFEACTHRFTVARHCCVAREPLISSAALSAFTVALRLHNHEIGGAWRGSAASGINNSDAKMWRTTTGEAMTVRKKEAWRVERERLHGRLLMWIKIGRHNTPLSPLFAAIN